MSILFLDAMPNMSIVDKLIAATIILFLLSQITEKITFFIRKNAEKKAQNWTVLRRSFYELTRLLGLKSLIDTNKGEAIITNHEALTENQKSDIENDVTILSLFAGIAVAIGFQANLFQFLTEDPQKAMEYNWSVLNNLSAHNFYNWRVLLHTVEHVFGLVLTGFFLSWGSKFFHDLLDLLYQIKDTKRKKNNAKNLGFGSADDVEKYSNMTELERVNLVLNTHKEKIKAIKGVAFVDKSYHILNGDRQLCLDVQVNNYKAKKEVEALDLKVKPFNITVPLYIEVSDGIVGQALIKNSQRHADSKGTMSGYVRDKAGVLFGITCLHVARGNPKSWTESIAGETSIIFSEGERIGEMRPPRYWEIDTVLIKIDNKNVPAERILFKENIFYLKEEHQKDNLAVKIESDIQKETVRGNLVNYDIQDKLRVTFMEGEPIEIENLFSISNNGFKMTEHGDSGAWIKTEDGKVIGMVVGADKFRTYAVKMTTIFEKLNLK